MKKVLVVCLFAFLVSSCLESKTEVSFISINPTSLDFTAQGGTKTATVYFTSTVKISVQDENRGWCEVSPSTATASKVNEVDSVKITVICQPNTTTKSRNGRVFLDNSSLNSSLFISQKEATL